MYFGIHTSTQLNTMQTKLLGAKNYFDLMPLEENIIATTLLLWWGEFFSVAEELVIECLAPDLPISYRQNHCC